MALLGPDGRPITSAPQNKKAAPPKLGADAFGSWAGRDIQYAQLPGGGIIQFDLSQLTLADYRAMRDHYQVNASLAVLSFMQHQADWHIECEDPKIAEFAEEQLRSIWTPLNRAMSTANWAGYSPNVLGWENNTYTGRVELAKLKDLPPEECEVNWKEVEGWAPPGRIPPKFKIYDGIKHYATPGWPIPVENSYWYPLLMEHGDYSGRKLLRPAFTSWYFSILVHLFANRYYERFGEPTPIGRAPYDDEIYVDGKPMKSSDFMAQAMQMIRSRAVVVLPNERTPLSDSDKPNWDYQLEYLESQMRGADFERYMTRLDEEISIGLFTPILLLRTADVGSYNLGVGHMQMYLWMLNAMNDDRAQYIDKYILRKLANYNFSERAPSPRIKFRKLGNSDSEMLRSVLTALIQNGHAKVDLKELGQMTGMTLFEVEETVREDDPPPPSDEGGGDPVPLESPAGPSESVSVAKEIARRVNGQVEAAFRDGRFDSSLQINMGFKRKMQRAMTIDGVLNAEGKVEQLYGNLDSWLKDITALGSEEFDSPGVVANMFERVLEHEVKEIAR